MLTICLGMRRISTPIKSDHRRHAEFLRCIVASSGETGAKKGYRLVGCNLSGYNASFIKQGIAEKLIPEIPIRLFQTYQGRPGDEKPLAVG
jgi:hypothetical protein